MSDSGFSDYLDSSSAVSILFGEITLAATFIVAVLATVFFSSSVHRSAVSTNVYICLLVFCLSYFVLPITGQGATTEPPFGACIASAMAIYGTFPLVAASILSLSITLCLGVFQVYRPSNRVAIDSALIAMPYLAWVGVMILTYVIGSTHKDEVLRHGYPYCFIASATIRNTCHALVAIFFLPCFILTGLTIYRLSSVSSPFRKNLELRNQMREPIIRMCIVCVGSIGTLGVALSLGRHWDHASQMIFLGSFPLVAVVELGTQREILKSWMRWAKRLLSSRADPEVQESHAQLSVSTSDIPTKA